MDNPKKYPESGVSQPPDSDSGQSFSATGMFAAMSESEAPKEPPYAFEPRPAPEQTPKPEATNTSQTIPTTPLAEPVVHRVVLSHGNEASSKDLIDRIRGVAAEREPAQEKAPVIGPQGSAPAPGSIAPGADAGIVGLTQLLRSMGLESETPQASVRPAPAVTPHDSGSQDSFTAMLASFAPPAGSATPAGSASLADRQSGSKIAPPAEASQPGLGAGQKQDPGGFTQQFSAPAGGSRTFRAMPEPSAAPTPIAQSPAPKVNAPAPPDRQSGEFTRLFYSIGGAAAAVPEPQASPSAASVPPASGSGGFTSLFNSLGGAAAGPSEPQASPSTPSAPPASGAGGFTSLFNSLGGAAAGPPEPQASPSTPSAPPASGSGGFTSLFNSLGGAAAGPSEPQPSRSTPSADPTGEPGAFTQMFQSGASSPPSGSGSREDFKASAGTGSFDLSQFTAAQPPSIHDPVARQQTEDLPFADLASSGPKDSVTQLLRRLDSPASTPPAPPAPAPVTPVSRGGSGGLTDIFRALDQPTDAGAKTGAQFDRPAQQPPQSAGAPPAWSGSGSATGINQRAVPPAPPPPASSGPSEFTQILDASRIRELALRGSPGAAIPPAPTAAAQAPAPLAMPAAPQVPSYPMPAAPQMGGMAAGAHPGGFPPQQPPMAGYPMSLGAHPGASPGSMPAGMPTVPGAHMPAIAAPTVPQPPAVAPPASGMGKLQQYVPLLLILIIFLLVGVLVTVVFLMKH